MFDQFWLVKELAASTRNVRSVAFVLRGNEQPNLSTLFACRMTGVTCWLLSGVVGSSPKAYSSRFGMPWPSGSALSAATPRLLVVPKNTARHCAIVLGATALISR